MKNFPWFLLLASHKDEPGASGCEQGTWRSGVQRRNPEESLMETGLRWEGQWQITSAWGSQRQFSELDFEDGSTTCEVKKETRTDINCSNKGASLLFFCFTLTAPGRKWSIPFFFRYGEFRVKAHTSELYIWAAQGMEMSLWFNMWNRLCPSNWESF